MRVDRCVGCRKFPCPDVRHELYVLPGIEIRPEEIRIVLISEAAPADPKDYYYARGKPLFQETTVQAFREAGAEVSSIRDILKAGVYLTTAVKCGKTGYGIRPQTVEECSRILEEELALFPSLKAILLMGEVAVRALNSISRRAGRGRTVPPGSIYRIRHGRFSYQGARVYPSYVQAGPSYFIEKSKRRMIAEDIASALKCE